MTTAALPLDDLPEVRKKERVLVLLVSSAHLVSHFHLLTLVALFPFLREFFDVSYVELSFALTVFSLTTMASQTPIGVLVDRFGSRTLLITGLVLSGVAFTSAGIVGSYAWLLGAMALFGVANSVYHPADYAILSAHVRESRVGRAFSVHTLSGYIGGALAPPTLVGVATLFGPRAALVTAGLLPLIMAAILSFYRLDDPRRPVPSAANPAPEKKPDTAVKPISLVSLLTPEVWMLTLFFALFSLGTASITAFSVVAVMELNTHLSLAAATAGLTTYMIASAFGVLAGGVLADRTRRHAQVAAGGFTLVAFATFALGMLQLNPLLLVLIMCVAGGCAGMIMPSRDMLVRNAAPAGASGRVFAIVTTGFSVSGAIGPMIYGWIMDNGAAQWVFYIGGTAMLITVVINLYTDRRTRHPQAVIAKT